MRAALFLALKDLRLLARDRAAAFFTFAFPLAVALFFGYVFSGTTVEPVKVVALVERASAPADALMRALGEDGGFDLSAVASREEGERAVRGGQAAALLVVPEGYEVDPSRRSEGAMLVGKVHEVAFRTVFESMSDPARFARMADELERSLERSDLPLTDRLAIRTALGRARAASAKGAAQAGDGRAASPALWRPVTVTVKELQMRRGVPANTFAISFMQGIAWALFGAVLSFCAGIAEERDRGTLVRLLTSPMGPGAILAGKALACFAACLGTEWFLVAVGAAFFGVSVSSWGWFAAASVATAFGFTGLMMILAGGFRTQGGAQGAGRAVLLVLAMIGGGTVPVVFMPPLLRAASEVSPFKWAVTVAEGVTWRGWGFDELWLPMALLAAVGASGMAVGAGLFRRSA
jgi:ABC-2 type transport system permease protein